MSERFEMLDKITLYKIDFLSLSFYSSKSPTDNTGLHNPWVPCKLTFIALTSRRAALSDNTSLIVTYSSLIFLCDILSFCYLDRNCFITVLRKASFASAVYATANPSVCPSVHPSVRHTPVFCRNEGTQRGC